MISLRYHIVSLVAVFLALALGIVVGSTVLQEGTVSVLRATGDRVREESDRNSRENVALKQELSRLQSFGATVAIHDKVTHRVHWCFGLEDGEVLVCFEIVNLAFDTRIRRPMRIPDGHAQREGATLQPDLAPRPGP